MRDNAGFEPQHHNTVREQRRWSPVDERVINCSSMPELAEVERGRRLLENAILDKKIIEVLTTEDALVFVDDAASILEKSLPGRTVLAVKRHGKNIYLKVDGQGPTLAFHLGSMLAPLQCQEHC